MQPDIENLRFRSRAMAPLVSLLLLLCSCDSGVRYVVTRRALLGDGCPDASRNFIMMRKLICCPEWEPQIEEGRIILGAGEDWRVVSGAGESRMRHSSDYVDVFGGALGSGVVWAR